MNFSYDGPPLSWMPDSPSLDFLGKVSFWIYFLTWLPFFLTMLVYGFGSPWYKSSTGKGIMLLVTSSSAVLFNAIVAIVLGDYPARDLVRAILVGGVSVAGWINLKNFTQLVLDGRRMRRGEDPIDPSITLDEDGLANRQRQLSPD